MIFRLLKHYLYGRIAIRQRDIVFSLMCFGLFYICKDYILNKYLKFSAAPYGIISISQNKQYDEKQYDFEKVMLRKENDELRALIKIPAETARKIVFAKVLTNIYAGSYFWAITNDTAQIKKGMVVWAKQHHTLPKTITEKITDSVTRENIDIGPRLIGFVEEIKGKHIKIRPITHLNSRFSAQTIDGDGVLLKGNMHGLDIVLSNSLELEDNKIVLYNRWLKIGIVRGKKVACLDFARIGWVCIEVGANA